MTDSPATSPPASSPTTSSNSPAEEESEAMPSPHQLAFYALEQATQDLESCLPTYSPPAVKVVSSSDVRAGASSSGPQFQPNSSHPVASTSSAATLEALLVQRGRHKPSPANRAVQYVRRIAPVARVAGISNTDDEIFASPSLVAASNALALVFAIHSRTDDALDQLEKIAYQAGRLSTLSLPSSPRSSRSSSVSGLNTLTSPTTETPLTVPALNLLTAVLTFLRGTLRRTGPPGTLRGRAPLGGAQAYSAAKSGLNAAVGAWDGAVSMLEGSSDEAGDF